MNIEERDEPRNRKSYPNLSDSYNDSDDFDAYNQLAKIKNGNINFWLFIFGLVVSLGFIGLSIIGYYHYLGIILSIFVIFCALFKLWCDTKDNRELLRIGHDQPYGVTNSTAKILKYTFVTFVVLLTIFILIKIYNVINQPMKLEFPDDCLPLMGWAQVTLNNNFRSDKIEMKNVVTYSQDNMTDNQIAQIIENCINEEFQSRIIYQRLKFEDRTTFFHAEFASLFFGFTDDMFIEVIECQNLQNMNSIQIQSKLRLGLSDFGINPIRIDNMYECIYQSIQSTNYFPNVYNYIGVWSYTER